MSGQSVVHTRKVAVLAVALALLALAGCGSDDPVDPGDDPVIYKWPETREDLVDNFEQAYGEMNITEYEKILHPDFEFMFAGTEIWERSQDITSTTNMFGGNQGHDEQGQVVLGVQSISVNTFHQIGTWQTQDPTHPYFPNTDLGLFDVQIVFYLEGGEHTITVTSEQQFYVIAEDVEQDDGTTRSRYFMVGQRDLGESLAKGENRSWGTIKHIYR